METQNVINIQEITINKPKQTPPTTYKKKSKNVSQTENIKISIDNAQENNNENYTADNPQDTKAGKFKKPRKTSNTSNLINKDNDKPNNYSNVNTLIIPIDTNIDINANYNSNVDIESINKTVSILINEEINDIKTFIPINTITICYDLKHKDTIDTIKSIILDNIVRPFLHKNEYYGLNITGIDNIENLEIKLKLIEFFENSFMNECIPKTNKKYEDLFTALLISHKYPTYIQIVNNELHKIINFNDYIKTVYLEYIHYAKILNNKKQRSRKYIEPDLLCIGRKSDNTQCTRKKIPNKDFCESHYKKEKKKLASTSNTSISADTKTNESNINIETNVTKTKETNVIIFDGINQIDTLDSVNEQLPTPIPKPVKRGRKPKASLDSRRYDDQYITLWEDLIDNEKVLVDINNKVYIRDNDNDEHIIFLGIRDINTSINFKKLIQDYRAARKQ